ncbi:ion channel [Bacillus smithii]|uniref:potassium channel family protein n=1 Tax=Bacillus smithii TaxID=1479 RepID=UPI003D1F83D8
MAFYRIFLRWPLVGRVLAISVAIIVAAGVIIHFLEPVTFPTIFEGIWWAVITASTVGYGDYVPATLEGRLIGLILIFAGAGFLTTYFASLAATAVTRQNAYIDGKETFKEDRHIVIIGWNERSRAFIHRWSLLKNSKSILLIDESLHQNPFSDGRVHFIKGVPYQDDTLQKGNVKQADLVLITADQDKNERQADMATILTIIAVKGMNPNVYCLAEILTAEQVENAKRAGADELIHTNQLASFAMLNSLLCHGMSDAVMDLLDHVNGSHFKTIVMEDEWDGLTFRQLSNVLIQKQMLLLGVKREEDVIINPPPELTMKKSFQLIIISD